jgi:hypothetical protein
MCFLHSTQCVAEKFQTPNDPRTSVAGKRVRVARLSWFLSYNILQIPPFVQAVAALLAGRYRYIFQIPDTGLDKICKNE